MITISAWVVPIPLSKGVSAFILSVGVSLASFPSGWEYAHTRRSPWGWDHVLSPWQRCSQLDHTPLRVVWGQGTDGPSRDCGPRRSNSGARNDPIVRNELEAKRELRLQKDFAAGTSASYSSGWNCYVKISRSIGQEPFPINEEKLLNYVAEAHGSNKLKTTTVSNYVDAVVTSEKVKGHAEPRVSSRIPIMLIGCERLDFELGIRPKPMQFLKRKSTPCLPLLIEVSSKRSAMAYTSSSEDMALQEHMSLSQSAGRERN